MDVYAWLEGKTLTVQFVHKDIKPDIAKLDEEGIEKLTSALAAATRVATSTDTEIKFVRLMMISPLGDRLLTVIRYLPDVTDYRNSKITRDEYWDRLASVGGALGPGEVTMENFMVAQVASRLQKIMGGTDALRYQMGIERINWELDMERGRLILTIMDWKPLPGEEPVVMDESLLRPEQLVGKRALLYDTLVASAHHVTNVYNPDVFREVEVIKNESESVFTRSLSD